MKLATVVLLLVIGFHTSRCDQEQDEIDYLFDQLEAQLKENQNIVDKLNGAKDEIIKEVQKGPKNAARVLGMAKSLNLAVPKLISDDSADVAQGVLNVVVGIAEFIPGGGYVAAFMSLISSIIGIVNGKKADDTIRTIVSAAIRESADEELEGKANAGRAELVAAMRYLQSKHDVELDAEDVTRMTNQIRVTTGIGILEMLANRIRHRSKATNKAESQQCFNFCLLYAQIASIRDLIMTDLIYQLRRAGDDDEANGYENVKMNNLDGYRLTLEFLNNPKPAQAGVVHLYHPSNHSSNTRYIRDFMKMARVSEPTKYLSATYKLRSVKWVHWKLDVGSYAYLDKNIPYQSSYMRFDLLDNGYWRLSKRDKVLIVTSKHPDYITAQTSVDRNNDRGHFVVQRYANSHIVTISCRKWPHKFWKGESGTSYVVLRDGFSGSDAQLTLTPSPYIDTSTGHMF